mgnify:CR=1 FL=1
MRNYNLTKTIILVALITFMGCSKDDGDGGTTPPPPVSNTLEGNYTGTWSSTTPTATFNGVSVSAKLQYSGSNTDNLIGEFFISGDYTVCCSAGSNDGTLDIDFDGDTITAFHYNDVITGCSGVFTGSGEIRATDKAFVIDFTGNDCDGSHVGQIILRKQS